METATRFGPESGLSLEKFPSVKARTGKSRSSIYRDIAAGRFPRPVKTGERASAWVRAEIDKFIAERIAERDANKAVRNG